MGLSVSVAPAMGTSNTDVAHVVWNTMFCCRTVADIVLEDFQQNAASHQKWAEMQRLLKFFRGATMSDADRFQAAVELEVVTLPVGSSSAQERWMTADNAAQRGWSEDNVSDAAHTQLQRICQVLSSVPSLPVLQQRHMDNGLTARWLIDPEDGPSGRQACPKGVYVVLTASLPDDAQTICAVPLGHNTVPQDCATILEERTIRPSYYDRGDDTWIPSLGFFCRLRFPSAAIREPYLDGTQWSHLLAMEHTCSSARKYGGTETATRPTCVLAWLYMRQHAHIKAAGGSALECMTPSLATTSILFVERTEDGWHGLPEL